MISSPKVNVLKHNWSLFLCFGAGWSLTDNLRRVCCLLAQCPVSFQLLPIHPINDLIWFFFRYLNKNKKKLLPLRLHHNDHLKLWTQPTFLYPFKRFSSAKSHQLGTQYFSSSLTRVRQFSAFLWLQNEIQNEARVEEKQNLSKAPIISNFTVLLRFYLIYYCFFQLFIQKLKKNVKKNYYWTLFPFHIHFLSFTFSSLSPSFSFRLTIEILIWIVLFCCFDCLSFFLALPSAFQLRFFFRFYVYV